MTGIGRNRDGDAGSGSREVAVRPGGEPSARGRS